MAPGDADPRAALEQFLVQALGARSVKVGRLDRLAGGAIQENYALDATIDGGPRAGDAKFVLRSDSPSGIVASHDRAHEFALIRAAHAAGVAVPEPIVLCAEPTVLGRLFSVMARVPGTAQGHILVRDDKWRGDRVRLAERLGEELAKIHAIRPPAPPGLEFLALPAGTPAAPAIATYRAWLDHGREARPALEWSLVWLEGEAPPADELVLCHRDFRTGNYLVDESGLTAILDWEFAGWGDPMEDIGWFCAKCWRFGQNAREAGGIGARADFYRGYERRSGRRIASERVRYWEIMAHARWALIALLQGERHVSGAELSLDLALTGRRAAELEYELIRMTEPAAGV